MCIFSQIKLLKTAVAKMLWKRIFRLLAPVAEKLRLPSVSWWMQLLVFSNLDMDVPWHAKYQQQVWFFFVKILQITHQWRYFKWSTLFLYVYCNLQINVTVEELLKLPSSPLLSLVTANTVTWTTGNLVNIRFRDLLQCSTSNFPSLLSSSCPCRCRMDGHF